MRLVDPPSHREEDEKQLETEPGEWTRYFVICAASLYVSSECSDLPVITSDVEGTRLAFHVLLDSSFICLIVNMPAPCGTYITLHFHLVTTPAGPDLKLPEFSLATSWFICLCGRCAMVISRISKSGSFFDTHSLRHYRVNLYSYTWLHFRENIKRFRF